MKRVLIVLGAIFGVVLVVAAAGIVFVIINGNALDKESQAYADETIPTIAQHWDQDEIAKRASPEFLKATKDDNFPKLLSMLRDNLGDFRKYKGSKGDANISLTTQNGKVITATYVASVDFDKAPATIQLKLIKHSDEWQILGFHVDSQAFLRP
ncbi:MAG TPA: hypothetical protein VNV38_13825 [Stellaceae bacterium]|jgi:hypothetical protein|nr:hypothetical protein [Stellaceae bacterium]